MRALMTVFKDHKTKAHIAFIKSHDNQSVELLQKASPKAPWNEMENIGP